MKVTAHIEVHFPSVWYPGLSSSIRPFQENKISIRRITRGIPINQMVNLSGGNNNKCCPKVFFAQFVILKKLFPWLHLCLFNKCLMEFSHLFFFIRSYCYHETCKKRHVDISHHRPAPSVFCILFPVQDLKNQPFIWDNSFSWISWKFTHLIPPLDWVGWPVFLRFESIRAHILDRDLIFKCFNHSLFIYLHVFEWA